MSKRTRYFESLEERRLLTGSAARIIDSAAVADHRADSALVDSSTSASRSDWSHVSAASPVGTPASAPEAVASDATAPNGDGDGAESPNEYLASGGALAMGGAPFSAANGTSLAAIDNLYLEPEASGTAPFYSGSSYAPTKTYTTTSTDQPATGPATLASMALPMPPLQVKTLAADEQPVASPAPAAGSPNIARSGVGGLEATPDEIMPPSAAAGPLADLEPPGTTAPVAMVPSAATSAFELMGRDWGSAAISRAVQATSVRDALDAYFAKSPWLAGLVSEAATADLSGVEQAVDRLCERMELWGEELLYSAGEWRFSESLVLAAGAAAAFEYVRAQFRESGSQFRESRFGPFAESTREPWQPRLRRSAGPPAERKRRFFRRAQDQT
jgi:hypothetical protein